MARIDRLERASRPAEYEQMCIERIARNEHNDCAVIAVALVTGVTYQEAHTALAAEGRDYRKGTLMVQTHNAIKKLGFHVERIPLTTKIVLYPGIHKNLRNVTTHHPARFNAAWADGHNYLFHIRAHVLAVKNGVVYDWSKGRAMRVRDVYRVTKI